MEATLPTGRSGRLLALGITGIALALVWLILVAPILGLYGDQAIRRDRDAALLVRMEQLVGRLPDLRDRAAALAEGGGQSFTIEGVSDAVAAATLQDTLQNMASVVGGNVASFETVRRPRIAARSSLRKSSTGRPVRDYPAVHGFCSPSVSKRNSIKARTRSGWAVWAE